MVKFAAMAQHELDLFILFDLDFAGCKQRIAVGFRHRDLHDPRGLFSDRPARPGENVSARRGRLRHARE